MNRFPVLRTLLVAVCVLGGSWLQAQTVTPAVAHSDALTVTVAKLDAELFDAYNTCDLKKLGAMVSDDLEFYHDITGLMVGKQPFLDAIKNNICGKVTRSLTPGTLEVHPLNTYGAVEMGAHQFHHPGEQDHDVLGEARFVMLWRNKDGVWKLTRVISYEHGTVK